MTVVGVLTRNLKKSERDKKKRKRSIGNVRKRMLKNFVKN